MFIDKSNAWPNDGGLVMKRVLIPTIVIFLFGCGSDFKPKFVGWTANTDTFKPILQLNLNGRLKDLTLPGGDSVRYYEPQWTKQNHLLLTQSVKRGNCYEHQIISIDTSGVIIDTVYKAPPETAYDFKLAPNDSVLILKTYNWRCTGENNDLNLDTRFVFYNRFLKKNLLDTIKVQNAININFNETVWSPDSKKVLIEKWDGLNRTAFVFDLVTKDTTFVSSGSDFIWSPSDKDLVAYIKNYSVYTKNTATGEERLIFKGRKKKSVNNFRWNPTGDFLMINISGYFLDIESYLTWNPTHIYVSMPDKRESKSFFNNEKIETWR